MTGFESKIQIEVQLTPADLDELWKNSPIRYLAWLLIGIGICSCYLVLAYLVNGESLFIVIEWSLAVVLAFFGGFFVLPLRVRQMFRASPSLKGLRRYSLSEEGVRFDSDLMTCAYRWESFSKIVESQKSFLLYLSPVFGIVIPKKCLAGPDDINRFRLLLRSQFRGKMKLRS